VQGLFDGPGPATESCPQRAASTAPLQALYLLNNGFAVGRARAFARRVRSLAGDERGKQVEQAFRLALGRRPDEPERKLAERFFADAEEGEDADAPLTAFCQALLNVNEFVYLE
jgi:hypothetical protein